MVQNVATTPERGVDGYPLSPMQQGMLVHHLQGRGPGVDIEQVIGDLREPINAAAFEQAWREVIERHTILRTSFAWDGEVPRQIVHAPSSVRLDFQHVEFGDEHEARRGLDEYLDADRAEGFDLTNAPLIRVALFRGSARHHWFVLTYHHLVLDTRAMFVVFKEALDLHDAMAGGARATLPPAPAYRNYIEWLERRADAGDEEFWRDYLRGFTEPTLLPRLSSANNSERGDSRGELMWRLTAEETARLRAVAKSNDVTLNTLVQSAWAIVLSRYTGESDVVFGAVRAGRRIPLPGAEALVGLLINTVPVRIQVNEDDSLQRLLQAVRGQWVAMREHEHTPLARIQQWAEIPAGNALFETLISFQDPSWDEALTALGDCWKNREWDIRGQPNYPLAIDAAGGARLLLKIVFDRRRFEDAAIAALIGHLRVVLTGIAREVARVRDLGWLTDFEQRQLGMWNATQMEFPAHRCITADVEQHAVTAPGCVAVADAAGELTYAQLNERANRLAHKLKGLGVGPDALVAVCMDRSTEMIVAWLAALKAGGAFVPLDPSHPRERLAFQLEDCRALVLLTQPGLGANLPKLSAGMKVIEVGPGGSGFDGESQANPQSSSGPHNLAYVIYTSGSTGLPKGVMIEHRGLMNLVTWHCRAYGVTAADRATHLASPAFDASVWEIWPYLASGASVHLPDDETRMSPERLWRWLAEKQITLAFVPTPLAEAALSEPVPRQLALRALLTGGDKLKVRPPAALSFPLINHYGPTENTVVATCGAVAPGDPGMAPTIGRPIANTRCYVLDPRRRVVPVGVTGELFIAGAGLARGYLNRENLTAEKFIADRVVGETDVVRLYRTGDLVRWNERGEIEFLGRLDNQVKIRGQRIELGEIEAALHAHRAVRECVVVARADEQGQLQLVAYIVPRGVAPVAGELSEQLKAKLPAAMIPSAYVFLTEWPLNPNGKIDRRALPAPDTSRPGNVSFAPPESPIEETIARVWSEILGRNPIGRQDNFFELGGHSLLAAQVISRLNRALSVSVSVRAVFDSPTVAGLAREVAASQMTDRQQPKLSQRLARRASAPELVVPARN